ncbi:MAG TPA: tyrosine-type recombinase/integrase [Pirellulales bacterium]|nr:tyrosine-type recombinase/integrase [Pirellulales bacterium]
MKNPKPYFRAFDGWWYIQLRADGKRRQIKLAKGRDHEAAAIQEWHKLCATMPANEPVVSGCVVELLDRFLGHCKTEVATSTFDWYLHFFKRFKAWLTTNDLAGIEVGELVPNHVTSWLKSESTWSKSTKNGAVRAIRRAFRWLDDEGHIEKYPLKGLKAPPRGRRETVVAPEKFAEILAAVKDQQFKDVLSFLYATGCRPQEVCQVESRHVQLAMQRIVFPASEAKGKEYPRVIYLNDAALEIVERLSKRWPDGKIFRNRRHKAWDRNAVRCRFRRLRSKVGHFCAYHLRHTFATEALQNLDAFTVSVLMGHADVSTLARQYQHLAKAPGFLQQAARKARGA